MRKTDIANELNKDLSLWASISNRHKYTRAYALAEEHRSYEKGLVTFDYTYYIKSKSNKIYFVLSVDYNTKTLAELANEEREAKYEDMLHKTMKKMKRNLKRLLRFMTQEKE